MILVLLSFFIDGIISNFLKEGSLFLPLLTIVSLIFIYPKRVTSLKRYIIYCGILGFLYDITYTQTLFLNVMLFILLGYLVTIWDKYFPTNLFNKGVCLLLCLLLYRFLPYTFLCMIGNHSFSWQQLWTSIYGSLILNYGYLILLALIFKVIDNIRQKRHHTIYSLR